MYYRLGPTSNNAGLIAAIRYNFRPTRDGLVGVCTIYPSSKNKLAVLDIRSQLCPKNHIDSILKINLYRRFPARITKTLILGLMFRHPFEFFPFAGINTIENIEWEYR